MAVVSAVSYCVSRTACVFPECPPPHLVACVCDDLPGESPGSVLESRPCWCATKLSGGGGFVKWPSSVIEPLSFRDVSVSFVSAEATTEATAAAAPQ